MVPLLNTINMQPNLSFSPYMWCKMEEKVGLIIDVKQKCRIEILFFFLSWKHLEFWVVIINGTDGCEYRFTGTGKEMKTYCTCYFKIIQNIFITHFKCCHHKHKCLGLWMTK